MKLNRREVLAMPLAGIAAGQAKNDFTFVHFTDLHIQPELRAAEECVRCVDRINEVGPSLVLAGGDLVFDANLVNSARAAKLVSLYQRTVAKLRTPLYNAIGNHDLFGVGDHGQPGPRRAEQARSQWEKEFGPRYRSFEHAGWHFIVLDSVDLPAAGGYRGWIDGSQLSWLKTTLRAIPKGAPIIVVTHVPLVTGFLQFGDLRGTVPDNALVIENAREVTDLLLKFNTKAVLQGHTHICETVQYHGCQFITTGAVCGNWWKGPRLGFPNGFTVARVSGQEIRFEYKAY